MGSEEVGVGWVVRPEQEVDVQGIRAVHEAAFPTPAEARLVDQLRSAGLASVSLVAVKDGEIGGHILFSPVFLGAETSPSGLGLAPVAVLPRLQGQGLGGMLIQAGLRACRELGPPYCVVLGSPEYYGRFGFRKASGFGLGNEYGVDEEFMVQELRAGGLSGRQGLVRYSQPFSSL